MFRVNEILSYNGRKYRVLALIDDLVVWIDVEKTVGMPSSVSIEELLNSIDKERLFRDKDPYKNLALCIPEKGSIAQIKRDKNYDLIRPIVNHVQFYNPKVRAALLKQAMDESGASKKTFYALLRRYWQRGQTPNALLPDYKNSGAKGKKRKATNKKLGRPRKYTPGVGAIVDQQVERLFRIAIDRYLLKDKKVPFSYAHRRFMKLYKNHFPDIPESEIPSKWQMLHFYKQEYGLVEKLKKRTPTIEYNKDVRPLKGTATNNVLGPGSRFEIDATIADIYLVSDNDRANIVGRPVIYMVIDVFSRMIAGFYVGFESPSYAAAMQALIVSMTDKVELCEKYDFKITHEDWPIVGLPNAILADRGELLGHQIESLEASFAVRIENTPPYRGDAKGIVERSFGTIQADFKPFASGVVSKTLVKKQGGKDYRLNAKLPVSDFKKIILSSILYHNRYHTLETYDRDADMPASLDMTPLALWNWGIQNRTGRLRAASEDALRISLLPRTKATISDLGISAFGVYYTSLELVESGWLHRSKGINRPVGFDAAYDPASAEHIYFFPSKQNTNYWVCNLAVRSREFQDCSFWEVWRLKDEQKRAIATSKANAEEQKRLHEEFVARTLKAAEHNAPDTRQLSNAERIRDIQPNKKQEKNNERSVPFHKPKKTIKDIPAKIIPISESFQEEDCSYPDYIDELFDNEEDS